MFNDFRLPPGITSVSVPDIVGCYWSLVLIKMLFQYFEENKNNTDIIGMFLLILASSRDRA